MAKIVIIGGGVAGLCAAVYARKCGYDAEIFEQHQSPGGLAASWRRGDYTFETCLHWLVGSNLKGLLNAQWREVCDIDKLTFVDHEAFVRMENPAGEALTIFTDVDRLEAELLSKAPEDEQEIRHFTAAIRQMTGMPMPWPGESWSQRAGDLVKMLPGLPMLWRLAHTPLHAYGRRFKHPLLRRFFDGGANGNLSVLGLVFSLAWMSARNAGYAVGGSQALIRLMVERLLAMGGSLRCGAKVRKILVRDGAAAGLVLDSGEVVHADWVISAADLHATLYDLLDGRYASPALDKAFDSFETFPSFLQVSLGIARDLSAEPGYLTLVLDRALEVDPETWLTALSFRIFNYDPTFAPPGKTAVTCILPTSNFSWWTDLQARDPRRYAAEKQRVAEAVVEVLQRRMPGVRDEIETVDVSTPATVINYTGNWKGSMEGWLMTPDTGWSGLPQTLPGLERFALVGQWVQPGGGLPGGLMTARSAIEDICRQDHVRFCRPRAA